MNAIRQITAKPCPVAAIGYEIARMDAAYEAAEHAAMLARKAGDGVASLKEDRAMRLLFDRMEHLDDAASYARAQSVEGALVQLMVAHGDMVALRDTEGGDREHLFRRMAHCMYSVRAVLEQISGARGEALGGDRYMSRQQDPFAVVAEALDGRQNAA